MNTAMNTATNTATVSNTNLFAVAAQYLGDATQWVQGCSTLIR